MNSWSLFLFFYAIKLNSWIVLLVTRGCFFSSWSVYWPELKLFLLSASRTMSHLQESIIKDNTRSSIFSFMSECGLSLKMQSLGDGKEKGVCPLCFFSLCGHSCLSLCGSTAGYCILSFSFKLKRNERMTVAVERRLDPAAIMFFLFLMAAVIIQSSGPQHLLDKINSFKRKDFLQEMNFSFTIMN